MQTLYMTWPGADSARFVIVSSVKIPLSSEWVSATAAVASAVAAFGSFGIVWGINKLNKSYLHRATEAANEAIDAAKRKNRSDAISDAIATRSQLNELSRQFALLQNQLESIAANKAELIDYAALQERIILLRRDINSRFFKLAKKAAEMQTACLNAVTALIQFRVQAMSDAPADFSTINAQFTLAHGALYSMEQDIETIVSDILSR
jgi:hypothetical protein